MTERLRYSAIVAIATLSVAACGDDPVAPTLVVDEHFDLIEVDGVRPPVDAHTLQGREEVCVNRVLEGSIAFSADRYDMWLYQQVICGRSAYPATERIQGSYEQEGGRLTLDPDVDTYATTITSATVSGLRVRMTATRTDASEVELEFEGQRPVFGTLTWPFD